MSLSTTLIASGVDWSLLRVLTSERLGDIERSQPRIVNGADFLCSALNAALSPHTRMRCAFESIYLCCCELAEASGLSSERVEHPNMDIVNAAASILNLADTDTTKLRTLTEWASSNSPYLPQLKLEDACVLARDVVVRTVRFFA